MPLNFFQFWRKNEPKSKLPISDIPLFSALGPAEVELIESKMRRVEYKKGDIVYKIGEKPEAFYIILLGRFKVIGVRGETLSVLSSGDYFGESSILLNRDHSATIEAKNDGLILKIDKKDFQDLLGNIPSLSLHLSRTLGHRLTAGFKRAEISKTKIISICDHDLDVQKRRFSLNLAALLGTKKKKAVVLGLENRGEQRFEFAKAQKLSLPDISDSDFEEVKKYIVDLNNAFHFLRIGAAGSGQDAEAGIVSLIGCLIERYDFILIDIPEESSDIGMKALQQSDLVYFLVGESNRTSQKALSYLKSFQSSFGFTIDELRFVLCEEPKDRPADAIRPVLLKDKLGFNVFCVLPHDDALNQYTQTVPYVLNHPESAYAKVLHFIVRELTGKLVGLVLGSGAAFGFAHIGVLRVLEKERIPVDIVAGSSIGALIAGLWAAGYDSYRLEEIAKTLDAKSIFFKLIGFKDLLLPHHGFFKGNQVSNFLRNYLDRKTFRELNIPVKIITTNLFTGEEIICDEGDVVDAIRASISIPGIFQPVKWGEQYLIDGGVVDPLPVKALNQYGVKKIIAVNVLSASEDHIQRKEFFEQKKLEIEASLKPKSFLNRMVFRFVSGLEKKYRGNVFNVLMNTIQFLEYGIAESSAASADIVIHPVLSDAHWAEFHSVEKFIKRGEEKALELVNDIKRLVEEGT